MADVTIAREGVIGIITLEKPRAINALDRAMVETILNALEAWRSNDGIRAVLIEGRGDKGFCAGGDVKAIRSLVLAGEHEEAIAFFAAEYRMNAAIARYTKPVIALQHGAVMGGGIGISGHARYRLCTPSSSFAMPEAAIGLFCDIGVNALLAQAPLARALAFLLSGTAVQAADAIALGLSDAAVDKDALPDIRGRLIEAARAGEPDTAIGAIIQAYSIEPGDADFCALADSLEPAFSGSDIGMIHDQIAAAADEGDPGAAALEEKLSGHCPTSLAVIFENHRHARRVRNVEAVLETDLKLARYMISRADFAEGVRAVLVDRDRSPRWHPDTLDAVDLDPILAALT